MEKHDDFRDYLAVRARGMAGTPVAPKVLEKKRAKRIKLEAARARDRQRAFRLVG